jgi:hypothetical protein
LDVPVGGGEGDDRGGRWCAGGGREVG